MNEESTTRNDSCDSGLPVPDRQPFAFEGGAECYSDQLRRMQEREGASLYDEDYPAFPPRDLVQPDLPSSSDPQPAPGVQPQTDQSQQPAEQPVSNKDLGKRGEDAAARYLERRGYNILARNWSCKHGEADIVAQDENALVFVEVKTRTNCDYGMPEEAVTPAKRNKYERIAASFLREYPCSETPVRFDVVGLLVISENRALVKHHINAFGVA